MKQTTIKDIARKMGVSVSTVSRALSGHPDISEETRKRIEALARELDYHPNTLAKSLQQKQSQVIGVVVPQVKHYFFASIMSGVTDVAYQAGFTVMICQSNEDFEREKSNIDVLLSHRVAGLLISVSVTTKSCEHFNRLKQRGVPLVFFDRVCGEVDAPTVVVDDYDGAFRAGEYLVRKGYRRFGHLGGPEFLSICRLRFEGFRDAVSRLGCPLRDEWVIRGGLNEEDGVDSMSRLLKQGGERPDAVFCVTDPVAMGALVRLKQEGIAVPDRMAVMGFTDNPMADLIEPPLTTVRQPAYEIGRTAAELLIERISNRSGDAHPVHKILKTELIIRKSA
ncbi:MAG: LacI family DNA-binding transcriptional regulator [bacterium]|nr:LacI family DNA-binding transcriptional regulator [bacterium]